MNNNCVLSVSKLASFIDDNELIDHVGEIDHNKLRLFFKYEKFSRHNRTDRDISVLEVSFENNCISLSTNYQIDEVFEDKHIEDVINTLEGRERFSCGHKAISSSPPFLILNYKCPLKNGDFDCEAINTMLTECNEAFVYVEDALWVE